MSKKVTLSDIAEALGVSIYTVSQALAGKPGVSRTTRKKVLDTAKALGYQMKASQKSEQRPPQKTDSAPYILVWSHAQLLEESMYWQRVLKGIGFGCKQYGWQYVIVPLETENPLVIPAYLDAESCVGGIAAGTVQSEFLVAVKQQNMPLVLVDHEERMLDADSVVNGNQEAAVSAAQRLIANGRKRLLFVGHDAFSVSFRERWLGFRFAADQREAPCTFEKWEIPYGHEGWKEALQAKVGESAPRFPDGCLCANDEIALELIKQLTAQNIRVPEECHVIGIDNIEMSQYAAPPLTTVDLAKESLGSRAVKALYDRVQDPKRRSEKIVLATQLIVRGSG